MPIAHVSILEGRTKEKKAEVIRSVTAALSTSLDVSPERVRVIVSEIPESQWGVAGETIEARRHGQGN